MTKHIIAPGSGPVASVFWFDDYQQEDVSVSKIKPFSDLISIVLRLGWV